MTSSAASCALVILSCDAYRDLWTPCLTLYRRYWPDCPYPMFLVSEAAEITDARVRSLRGGTGLPWSDLVRVTVGAIDCEYVLLMLDDFFLTGRVSTSTVDARRAELRARGGAYLRLVPRPRPTARVPGWTDVGEHERGAPFRASLQAAFWRTRVLLDLLEPGESPWEFERNASLRSGMIGAPFFAVRRSVLPCVDVLERGRWFRRGHALCRHVSPPRSDGRAATRKRTRAARRVRTPPEPSS
jgi:hypothetical protein